MSYRRDFGISLLSSVLVTGGILGALSFVTFQISEILAVEKANDPIVMDISKNERPPKEPAEKSGVFERSSSMVSVGIPQRVEISRAANPAVAVPEFEPVLKRDELAWSDETFEPWVEEKGPEVEPVTVRKAPPLARKVPVVRPTPKPALVKAVPARLVARSAPVYPSKARRLGLEGRCVITVTISTSGRVASARITSSSRHSLLDAAALNAAKKYRFSPAKDNRGQVVATQVSLPFNFKLT